MHCPLPFHLQKCSGRFHLLVPSVVQWAIRSPTIQEIHLLIPEGVVLFCARLEAYPEPLEVPPHELLLRVNTARYKNEFLWPLSLKKEGSPSIGSLPLRFPAMPCVPIQSQQKVLRPQLVPVRVVRYNNPLNVLIPYENPVYLGLYLQFP